MNCRPVTGHSLMRRFLAVLLMLCAFCDSQAQTNKYKFDAGVQLGMSGYVGEANSSNIFKKPGFDGELSFRYIGDSRWALRAVLSTLGISGTTEGMDNVLPEGQVYTFKSQVYDLGFRGEFNFLPYGIGETYKRLRRWTPYITAGVGVALATSGGKSFFAPTIPLGLGFKFKLRPRLNLGVEFTMTKAFNDNFDGSELADLDRIKIDFYKNTDWYSRLTIGISYEFGERCETCHYVD